VPAAHLTLRNWRALATRRQLQNAITHGGYMTQHTVESISRVVRPRDRLRIKAFRDAEAMHKFLATGDNALWWKESTKGLKAGTYAYAGGRWHNVRTLPPEVLAHV
jgi:hypothetical protein